MRVQGLLCLAFAVAAGLQACAPQPPSGRPFTSPPFIGAGELAACPDHDPRAGHTLASHPTISCDDGEHLWGWAVPEGTAVLAVAAGTVAHILSEPECAPRPSRTVFLSIDPPHNRWLVGFGGLHPTVNVGDHVPVGEPIGTAARHHAR